MTMVPPLETEPIGSWFMARYFRRLRGAAPRSDVQWRRKIEQRTAAFDERQTQVVDRYAEMIRLHVAFLDSIAAETGIDVRGEFAEFVLVNHRDKR